MIYNIGNVVEFLEFTIIVYFVLAYGVIMRIYIIFCLIGYNRFNIFLHSTLCLYSIFHPKFMKIHQNM